MQPMLNLELQLLDKLTLMQLRLGAIDQVYAVIQKLLERDEDGDRT